MKLLLLLALLITSFHCLSQPYGGTIFVDEDIITSSDSSAFVNATYTGRGMKRVYDRRVSNWDTINAYLFEVVWNDGLNSEAVINPEFANVPSAEIEAEKYGRIIGQLPYCLRTDVDEIWIHKGVELFGGGLNSILIHTGQTEFYENNGILEETLVHEACHTSLDAAHSASAGWLNAQILDEGFISDYAEDFPYREDIAESFLMWMALRYREDRISTLDFNLITAAIPNRLTYFDGIVCDLFPFQVEEVTSLNELYEEKNKVVVFPNPTTDFVQLELNGADIYSAIIYNSLGNVVFRSNLRNIQAIDLSNYLSGIYYLSLLRKDGCQIIKKIIKN